MMADVAVMSHDLSMVSPDVINAAAAMITICDGKVTFER
jgi:predicted amidohydrolase YtcJ